MRTRQREWLFLFACLFLGVLAEASFLHGRIGIAYIIFIAAFYTLLFIRFRFSFEHRRIGLLLMAGIWVLAGSYLFFDSTVFYLFNLLVIPLVVFFHVVVITSPAALNWSKLSFIRLVTGKLLDAFSYLANYLRYIGRKLVRNRIMMKSGVVRQIIFGVILAVPLLFIVIQLLMTADESFQQFIQRMFYFEWNVNIMEFGFRIAFILVAALFFFCIFQVLGRQTKWDIEINQIKEIRAMPGVMAATILLLLNMVYILFIAFQFSYFFQGDLEAGFTYADYARRGFFELILVTLINWALLLGSMKRVQEKVKGVKVFLKVLYSALIIASGVLLASAWQRLALYEEMYGYTVDRLLAHSFMLFLVVIFAYTLIRVWLVNLPILHFYLISAFLFYTLMNVVNIEEIIVESNLARYEESGKVDIHYLDYLGAEGVKGLIYLYEQDPAIPELKQLLNEKKEQLRTSNDSSWQSFNFAKNEARQLLEELEL